MHCIRRLPEWTPGFALCVLAKEPESAMVAVDHQVRLYLDDRYAEARNDHDEIRFPGYPS